MASFNHEMSKENFIKNEVKMYEAIFSAIFGLSEKMLFLRVRILRLVLKLGRNYFSQFANGEWLELSKPSVPKTKP